MNPHTDDNRHLNPGELDREGRCWHGTLGCLDCTPPRCTNCHTRAATTHLGECSVCDGQGDTSDGGRERIEGVREAAAFYQGTDSSDLF